MTSSSNAENAPEISVRVTLFDPASEAATEIILDHDGAEGSVTDEESGNTILQFKHRFPSGHVVKMNVPKALVDEGELTEPCPVCGCQHLYRQRDFNRNLGLTVVVVAAVVGLVLSSLQGTMLPLVVCLIIASIIDAMIFSVLREVFVCYQCLTCFRGVQNAESIETYEQEIADGFDFAEYAKRVKAVQTNAETA
jgi:hypothetical protein